jgi:hypothetical protein
LWIEGLLFTHGNHVELLGGSDESRDQYFEWIPPVVGWKEWSRERFSNEAEEFFPAARNDEPDELGVCTGDLVLVDRSLNLSERLSRKSCAR